MDEDVEEELMRKIRALEEGQAELKREVSRLQRRRGHHHQPAGGADSSPQQQCAAGLSSRHHVMAMQSLGQAVHVLDLQGKVLYWNRCAEDLYGYSASEAVGQDITGLIIVPGDIPALNNIIGNVFTGKCWRGKFPVRNKSGERFSVVADATPLCDDDGRLVGLVCLADGTQTLEELIACPVDL
ncbi:hypothetical protein BS78_07G210100 [Paspalum vaginatum]|nr:hypothetical protein BS78_07G210100 [Paspalum vaginatum]